MRQKSIMLILAAVVAGFLSWVAPQGLPMVKGQGTGTPVSGIISADTAWTVSNSPYIATGNILVADGVTLTIEPGVQVKFEVEKYLRVDGTLVARGTPDSRITFTSNAESPTPSDWYEIRFSDSSVDAQYDGDGSYLSGSVLEYCDILFGGGRFVSGGQNGVIKLDHASPLIKDCEIRSQLYEGIFGWAADEPSHTLKILNNKIAVAQSGQAGIAIASQGSAVEISGNRLFGQRYYSSQIDWYGTCRALYLSYGHFTVRDNYFSGWVAGIHSYNVGELIIEGNLLTENSYAVVARPGMAIQSNTFYGNEVDIVFTGYQFPPTIVGNNFLQSNLYALSMASENWTCVGLGATSGDISVPNNYWDSVDPEVISAKIYDFYDDFALGQVNYDNWATAAFENAFPTPPGTPTHLWEPWSPGYDGDIKVEFVWEASWDDIGVDHYNVYLSTDGSPYGSPIATATNYIAIAGQDGRSYKIKVEAVDGAAKVSPMSEESTPVVVDFARNSPPTAPVVNVTPHIPVTADALVCTIVTPSSDPDGETITYSYQWYKDGVLQAGLTTNTVAGANTSKGEAWRCVVTPNDGTVDGPSAQDQVVVTLGGDADRDYDVDTFDLALVANAFNIPEGDPGYNANADFNRDGIIDILDLVMIGINWGKTG